MPEVIILTTSGKFELNPFAIVQKTYVLGPRPIIDTPAKMFSIVRSIQRFLGTPVNENKKSHGNHQNYQSKVLFRYIFEPYLSSPFFCMSFMVWG